MADIRFKILGTAAPFTANVCVNGTTTLVTSEIFEYSGVTSEGYCNHTCAIIGGLSDNTTYKVNLIDSIGNTCSFCQTTPSSPVVTPVYLTVGLGGYVASPAACVVSIVGNAGCTPEIYLSPALTGNQEVKLCMCVCSNYTTGDYSTASIYKKCGSGSYSRVLCADQSSSSVSINVKAGDCVCYAGYSTIVANVGTSCSYADVELLSVTPVCGFGTCYDITCGPNTCLTLNQSCTITTTTTTAQPVPISVSIGDICTLANTCIKTMTGSLCVEPPLTTGQCFRLVMYSKEYYCYASSLSRIIEFSNYGDCCGTLCTLLLNSTTSGGPVSCTRTCSFYYDVTPSNQNDICFSVKVCDHTANVTYSHVSYGCMCICSITCPVGGTYSSTTIPDGNDNKIYAYTTGVEKIFVDKGDIELI